MTHFLTAIKPCSIKSYSCIRMLVNKVKHSVRYMSKILISNVSYEELHILSKLQQYVAFYMHSYIVRPHVSSAICIFYRWMSSFAFTILHILTYRFIFHSSCRNSFSSFPIWKRVLSDEFSFCWQEKTSVQIGDAPWQKPHHVKLKILFIFSSPCSRV